MCMKRFNDFKLYFGYIFRFTLQFNVFQVYFKYITIIISNKSKLSIHWSIMSLNNLSIFGLKAVKAIIIIGAFELVCLFCWFYSWSGWD